MFTSTQSRVTIVVSSTLHQRLKPAAVERHTTVRELVTTAIESLVLNPHKATSHHQQVRG